MRNFNFPVRKFDGTFYKQFYPFNPFFFGTRVHPLVYLHQFQLTFAATCKPIMLLSEIPKYRLDDDGTMSLNDSC